MSLLAEVLLEGHWARHAACRDLDPRLFTPNEREDENEERLEDGRRICIDLCLVREECLAHAIEHKEPSGVWGGQRATERGMSRRATNRGRAG